MEEVDKFVCRNCRWRCAVCNEAKAKAEFPASMWHHRFDKDQRTLCFDCSKPRCTSQQCTICPTCRDPDCKARMKCKNEIKPLNSKQLPQTMMYVQTYLCQTCQKITCKCGNRMSQTMQKKRKKVQNDEKYVCV